MSKQGYWWQQFKKLPGDVFYREVAWKFTQAARLNLFQLRANYMDCEVSSEHGKNVLHGKKNYKENLPPFFIDPRKKKLYRQAIEKHFKATQKEKIIQQAERVCQRRFYILGKEVDLSASGIDWHKDFKTGYRWDPGRKYFDKKVLSEVEVGGGSDNKVPWELSRLQFIIPLGKAYWLSGDDKYARQFVDILSDWLEHNPPYYGIHWCSAMEVAIRAANIIWGLYFFSSYLSEEYFLRIISLLEWHGRFIWGNLEKWFESTGNHYLGDLAGLLYLGVFLQKPVWRDFAFREIISQSEKQVLADGASFEASTSYHRLALEFIFYPAILCRLNNISLPQSFWAGLEKMFVYSQYYVKPNGCAPQIGDNDSGRLHLVGQHSITDHSYLSAVAGALFDRDSFKTSDQAGIEEILWLFGPDNNYKPVSKYHIGSRMFPDAGMYVMRFDKAYMIISCGRNGYYNKGSHAHNDKLSFELNLDGDDFIVDPGSYVYTPYPEERDMFRSTAYHNTVRVDKAEQNRIPPDDVFRLEHDSDPQLIKWQSDSEHDIFEGMHDGYNRLQSPVQHIRRIVFNKKLFTWQITDTLHGEGKHLLEWYFHPAPGIKVDISKTNIVLKGRRHHLVMETGLKFQLLDGYYSPEYGCKEKAVFIYCPITVDLPYSNTFIIKTKKAR